jgi:hypothetical protein
MRQTALLLLAAGALTLAGCSSTPTRVDKGPIRARTFTFVNPGPQAASRARERMQPVHQMIQEAITKNLAARGIARSAGGADITVAYLLVIGNNASTELIDDYFGYGGDGAALLDKASTAYSDSKNPNYFVAGTILIDLVDSRTRKLLKRNYTSRELLRNPSSAIMAARIQEAVNEILSDLRVVSP